MAETGRRKKAPDMWPLAYSSGFQKMRASHAHPNPQQVARDHALVSIDFNEIEKRVLEYELAHGPLSIYK